MNYDNIIDIWFGDGSGVVVRKGEVNDWAAYYVDEDQEVDSGSLVKLSPSSMLWSVVNELVQETYPELTYRP